MEKVRCAVFIWESQRYGTASSTCTSPFPSFPLNSANLCSLILQRGGLIAINGGDPVRDWPASAK
jgi:hypothetical protein